MLPSDIDKRFDYHPPSHPGIAELHGDIRNAHKQLALVLAEVLPAGRESSLSITKLEESMMWANAAIARNQEAVG